MDKNNDLYFIHKKGDPFLNPVSGWLQQLGVRKSKGSGYNTLNMHYNDGIEICYVLKGIYRWKVEDRYYQVYPGEAFITCPWQWHGSPDEVLDKGILGWAVILPKVFTKEGVMELGGWSSLKEENQQCLGRYLAGNADPVVSQAGDLADTFRKVRRELYRRDVCYKEEIGLMMDSLLISLLRSLKERKERRRDEGDFASQLHETWERELHEKISIEDYALRFGMSPSSFNKKVKSITGFSPAEYLIGLRINKAKRLLAASNEKMIDIALDCGFSTSQYFAAQFTKWTGLSPSRYRSRINAGEPC